MTQTREYLKFLQGLPLRHKISFSLGLIKEFQQAMQEQGKGIQVSYSGGKDSTVLLDLVRRVSPDTAAIFADTGLEYPEIRRFALGTPNTCRVRPAGKDGKRLTFPQVVKEHGWCYPSKDIAEIVDAARRGRPWALLRLKGLSADGTPSNWRKRYKKWAFLVDLPIKISDKCCYWIKERPLAMYARTTKTAPIVGTMAAESQRRTQAWLRNDGCNTYAGRRQASKPLSFWTEQDILRYLRDYGISYCKDIYGDIVEDPDSGKLMTTGADRTGCMFCPIAAYLNGGAKFRRMAASHPKLYQYVMYQLKLHELFDAAGVEYLI